MHISRFIVGGFTNEVRSRRSIAGLSQHFTGRSAASRSEPFLRSRSGGRSSIAVELPRDSHLHVP